MKFARHLLVSIFALFSAVAIHAQGTVQGGETTPPYTGGIAQIANPGTPATNFLSTGVNTFIIPVPISSSVRLYVTNNTNIACAATFTVQMFAAGDAQVSSFNNNLSLWQNIPLQSTSGSLVQQVTLNIPASGLSYVDSTAISSPRVTIQLVNTNAANCVGVTLESIAVVTPISKTSPLISSNSPNGFNPTSANQIQGIVGPGLNAALVNPVVVSGLQPAVNSGGLNNLGIDFTITGNVVVGNGFAGTITRITTLAPTTSTELALGLMVGGTDTSSATVGANSPWICQNGSGAYGSPGGCSTTGGGRFGWLLFPNVTANVPLNHQFANANGTQNNSTIVTYLSASPTIRLMKVPTSGQTSFDLGTTLAGSTIVAGFRCNNSGGGTAPCVSAVTDSQGGAVWKQLGVVTNASNNNLGLSLWARSGPSIAADETITPTLINSNTNVDVTGMELTGLTSIPLNQPNIGIAADTLGNQVTLTDQIGSNEFALSVTISTNTTTQIVGVPATINNIPVRAYITDIQINTTAAGTATTLALVSGTGTNCATSQAALSGINYVNTVVGLQSIIGPRTPLVAPLSSAVCVTQAGTTAGTSVVELRGFFNP